MFSLTPRPRFWVLSHAPVLRHAGFRSNPQIQNLGFFVGIILILVNGHVRGGVSAFFRDISAFF